MPVGQPRGLACKPGEGMKAASEVRWWLRVGWFQSATDPCKRKAPTGARTRFNLKRFGNILWTLLQGVALKTFMLMARS